MHLINRLVAGFIILVLNCHIVRADTESQIRTLHETFVLIVRDIASAPQAEQPQRYDALRERVSAMVSGLVRTPDGSDTIKPDRSDELLVDFVYSAFLADQDHLDRVVTRTAATNEAIAAISTRVRCLAAMYPIGATGSCCEQCYFVQYLARAYRHIPSFLPEIIRPQMSRWKANHRIPELLVLSEGGDLGARTELENGNSPDIEKMKTLFRHILTSHNAQKNSDSTTNSLRKID